MNRHGPDPSDSYRSTGPADPFEARLAGRIAEHAERGVRPIDAAAIAREAAAGGRGSRVALGLGVALGRLGWLLAGAALAAAAIGGTMWAGSHGPLGGVAPVPSPSPAAVAPTVGPSPTSFTPTTGPASACTLADLSARVTSWTGAAGNRIAQVVMTNTATVPCIVRSYQQVRLVDGDGTVLLDSGHPIDPTPVTIPAGGHVATEVDDANYCGAKPTAPVTVAFVVPGQAGSGTGLLVAQPRSPTDVFGVPECLGPGGPGQISMHPWAP